MGTGDDKKGSIEGKWVFEKFEYTSANKEYEKMSAEEKAKEMDEILAEATGTTFEFRSDNSYETKEGKSGRIQKGVWAMGSAGQLTLIRDGGGNKDIAMVTFPAKNMARLEDASEGIIVFLKRAE